MDDWSVGESDDEWKVYGDVQSKKNSSIPEKIARLFNDVNDKKVLPLTCFCPRMGPPKEGKETISSMVSQAQPVKEEKMDIDKNISLEQNKSFEAFDFDNEDNEKPSAKRKTPSSGKRQAKKEKVSSSMTNVMNDILRHKLLDELEANKKDELS